MSSTGKSIYSQKSKLVVREGRRGRGSGTDGYRPSLLESEGVVVYKMC